LYTIVAMGVMVYALIIYQYRAKAIRTRSGAPYDDRLGPVSAKLHLSLIECLSDWILYPDDIMPLSFGRYHDKLHPQIR
jgi:hypothetical protein